MVGFNMHCRAGLSSIAAVAVLLAASPLPAQSQLRPGAGTLPPPAAPIARGTIDGVVSDTGLVPIQAAFVSILGTNVRVGTGPNGRFRITRIPAGQYLLIVKRVGYRPTSGVIDVTASDTLRLSYSLEKLRPNELETVVVTSNSPSSRMVGFEARRKLGVGEFMTADQIKARNSVFTTELMRNFKAVDVSPNHANAITTYYALSRREGGNPTVGACPMQVYLDQVPLPTPFNLDLLPPPRDVAGIEVYAGAASIPPEFNGYNRGCGVILVWTKEGGTD
jgi:hypothetical protein